MITPVQLQAIMPTAGGALIAKYCDPLNTMMALAGINTPLRVAHFLAQCGEETGDMHVVEECLNYSAARLIGVWPSLYDSATAAKYAHNPQMIANRSYGNRYGNGPESSGDGWTYRGRGFIQLTFQLNYKNYGLARHFDALTNPDVILTDPDRTVDTACWYWQARGCNQVADKDDVVQVTRMVNGGLLNLPARQTHLVAAKKALGLTVS